MNNWKVDPAAPQTVEGMICSLAGVCDGAHQNDKQGFSGADTEFGHSLANRAQQGKPFTLKQAQAALKMINKYRRQLGGASVVGQFLQQPVFRMPPWDARSAADNALTPQDNGRTLTSRDTTAVFKFPYDPELVTAVKAIRGQHRDQRFFASWNAANKVWHVPVNETSIGMIMSVAEQWCFAVEDRFLEYRRKVEAKTASSRMMLGMNGGQNIVVEAGMIQIAIDNPAILKEFEHALGQ